MALYEYRKACVATYKRVWQQAFEMLEPLTSKDVWAVLRGGGDGNVSFLPDYGQIEGADKGNIKAQNQFIAGLFGLVA